MSKLQILENFNFPKPTKPNNFGFPEVKFGDPISFTDFNLIDPIIPINNPIVATKPILVKKQAIKKVKSQVFDDLGNPFTGVSVHLLSNPTKGTTTDFDGFFYIDVKDTDVLVIQHLGFETVQIPVSKLTGKVILKESNETLPGIEMTFQTDKPKKTNYWVWGGVAAGVLVTGLVIASASKKTTTKKSKGLKGVAHVTI